MPDVTLFDIAGGDGTLSTWDATTRPNTQTVLIDPGVAGGYKCDMSGGGNWIFYSTVAGIYKVNTTTLAYTLIPNTSISTYPNLGSLCVWPTPDGSAVYIGQTVVNGSTGRLLKVDATTGAVLLTSPTTTQLFGAARAITTPDDQYVFVNGFGFTKLNIADLSIVYSTNEPTAWTGAANIGGITSDGLTVFCTRLNIGHPPRVNKIRLSDGTVLSSYLGSVITSINGFLTVDQQYVVIMDSTLTTPGLKILSPVDFSLIGQVAFPLLEQPGDCTCDRTAKLIYAPQQLGFMGVVDFTAPSAPALTSYPLAVVSSPRVSPIPGDGPASGAPATPTGLATVGGSGVTPGICTGPNAPLLWNTSAGATYYTIYTIYRNGTPAYIGSLTAFTDPNLTEGTTYSYTVTASNGSGTSAPSAAIMVTPCATCVCDWEQIEVAPIVTWARIETPCGN